MASTMKYMKLDDAEWSALEWAMEYTIEMLNEHSDEDDPERLQVLATLEVTYTDLEQLKRDRAKQSNMADLSEVR